MEGHIITTVRTANIHDGKMQEAWVWAVKAAKYLNEKFGTNVSVHRNLGGPLFQVHWVATCESLAAFEKVHKQVDTDPGFQELIAHTAHRRFPQMERSRRVPEVI